jgi:hypothetical protein
MRRSASLWFVIVMSLFTSARIGAQSDLDALMARVLARRDDNWKRLQQYVLEERETIQITGPGAKRSFGYRREYLWFPRDGRFIKSPVSADGVTVGEDERRRAEAQWLQREERREKRRREGGDLAGQNTGVIRIGPNGVDVQLETAMRDALEPGFVSAAYFLNFRFDPGQYALVGRDTYEGRQVLRIEYYPTLMFKAGRTRPNKELRDRDKDVERQMNKVSLVTFWVDPAQSQIVKYEFANMDMDFLPGSWLIRPDGWNASMEMGQPFPDVWLPRSVSLAFEVSLAVGDVGGRYLAEYHDYRLASVDTRVK